MARSFGKAGKKQLFLKLYAFNIPAEQMALILGISRKTLDRYVLNALWDDPSMTRSGDTDSGAANAYAAAICGELDLTPKWTARLLCVLDVTPNPSRSVPLQERVRQMQSELSAATARVKELESALADIKHTATVAIDPSLEKKLGGLPRKKTGSVTAESSKNGGTHIDAADLSVNVTDKLREAGIHFIEDLTGKTVREVLRMMNGSQANLREVTEKMAGLGLSLKA